MRSFVYESRVIENERQIKFERNAKRFGKLFGAVVEFFVVFLLFVIINVLLSDLMRNANQFMCNVYRLIQDSARVFVGDNALSTLSFVSQHMLCIVLGLTFTSVHQVGLVVRTLGNGEEDKEKEQDQHNNREEKLQSVNTYSFVSYKNKVCFLS